MDKNFYLAVLHSIGISQRKLSNMFSKNSNYKEFFESLWNNNLKDFYNENEISKIISNKNKLDINFIKNILEKNNVKLICINDENYPKLLKQISNPPFLLYVRWKIDNSPKLAVIWSRNMTSYWEKAIEKIIPWLVSYFTIVSWWAIWCDSEAHIKTLENSGKTIAVIWTWIDINYPSSNKILYEKIINNSGAIISIFPVWEKANNYNFPIRNEIIAWISSWVIVIESSEKSWTLITVNLALEQWKDVFSVPWDIFKSNSIWCNNLIKNWNAKMICQSSDILEEYNINFENKTNDLKLDFSDNIEKNIYDILLLESFDIDELIQKTWFSLKEISTSISMLEIKWIIKKSLSWKYEIC